MHFEQVDSFKYLGIIDNKNNTIEEEMEEGIMEGNKALYGNKKMFQDKLLSKRYNLILYWSVIRPVVTYKCETWILKKMLYEITDF
jgi:hypothetical protein